MQPLERPDDQIAAIARDVEVGVDCERAGLDDLELEVQSECGREHIESGAQVRR
jgi:hypothetical protein